MSKKKLPAGMREKAAGYEYRFRVDGKRYSVFAKTPAACREKEIALRTELQQGTYTENRNITVSTYFEEYLRSKSGSVVEATIIHNRTTFKRIDKEMGKKKLREIEARQVAAFREKLEKEIHSKESKLTTHGGNDILELLSSIFTAAVNDGIITRNPAAGAKRFKRIEEQARDTVHRRLSPDELRRFFAAAETSFYFLLLKFLLLTGVRVGEALALYWTDVNFETDTITVARSVTKTAGGGVKIGSTAKTAAGQRTIPMNDDIRRVLAEQKARNAAMFGDRVTGLVFPSTTGGVARPSSVDTCLKGIARAAGVDHFGAHAFRHTFASSMVDAGVSPEVLKNILGHTNVKITIDTYYHVDGDRLRDAMQKKVVAFRSVV